MAKKPGVPLLKNWIKHQGPAQPKKTRLERPAKRKSERQEFLWDETSPEEGLEDTPVMPLQSAKPVERTEIEKAPAEELVETATGEKLVQPKHRRSVTFAEIFGSVTAWFSGLFSFMRRKSKGNNAALVFAESRKRLGRKGRRNRRIFVYAGSGLAVVIAVLLVLLVPGGAAAPVDVTTGFVSSDSVTESASAISVAVATQTATPSPTASPTPIPTTAVDPVENPIDMNEVLEFYVVNADSYYKYSNNHYNYTQEEVKMLAQLIWGEARGQSLDGKIAVANVVLNRVLCPGKFGSTIKAVVTASGQFSGYKSTNPTTGCISAARWVLDYEVWKVPQDVYYFRSARRYSSLKGQAWGGHTYYCELGGHFFYRESYSGRTRNRDVPPRLYDRVYKYARYGCEVADRVYRIQYMLDALGYDIEKVDSYFGKGTKEALIDFQQDQGLDDDGIAGPATVQALIEAYGIRNYYSKFYS